MRPRLRRPWQRSSRGLRKTTMQTCVHTPRHEEGSQDCRISSLMFEAFTGAEAARDAVLAVHLGKPEANIANAEALYERALEAHKEAMELLTQKTGVWHPKSRSVDQDGPRLPARDRRDIGASDWIAYNAELVGSIALVVDHYRCSVYLGEVRECYIAPAYYGKDFPPFRGNGWIYIANWARVSFDAEMKSMDIHRIARSIVRYGPTEGSYLEGGSITPNVLPINSLHLDAMILRDEAVAAYGLWLSSQHRHHTDINAETESQLRRLAIGAKNVLPRVSQYLPRDFSQVLTGLKAILPFFQSCRS